MNFLVVSIVLSINVLVFGENLQTPMKAAVWIVDKTKNSNSVQQYSRSMEISHLMNYIIDKIPSVQTTVVLKSANPSHRILSNEGIINSIKESPSSVLMPNIYTSSSFDTDILKNSKHFEHVEDISLTELAKQLKNKSNKKAKAYSVQLLNNNEENRSLLQEIQQTAENVMFIAVEQPADAIVQRPVRHSEFSRILMNTTSNGNIYYKPEGTEYAIYYAATYLYITPDIFTALLTMIFMAFTVYIGLNCLGEIQTPSTFALAKPSVGREA